MHRGRGRRQHTALLRWRGRWTTGIEKVGDCGHKLRGRERFWQHDAIGYALRGPIIGTHPAHVDDRKSSVDFSDPPRDFPTVPPTLPPNIANDPRILFAPPPQQRQRLLAS